MIDSLLLDLIVWRIDVERFPTFGANPSVYVGRMDLSTEFFEGVQSDICSAKMSNGYNLSFRSGPVRDHLEPFDGMELIFLSACGTSLVRAWSSTDWRSAGSKIEMSSAHQKDIHVRIQAS